MGSGNDPIFSLPGELDEEEGQGSDNANFQAVYDCQEELQDLLDTGGEADEAAEVSLGKIKNAGQRLLDAINNLSLADFEEEFADTETVPADDNFESIFVER